MYDIMKEQQQDNSQDYKCLPYPKLLSQANLQFVNQIMRIT